MGKKEKVMFLAIFMVAILSFVFTGCMPVKAKYTVEYYLQNIENNEFTIDLENTYTAQGSIDEEVRESPKNIEGFSFVEADSVLQGTIVKDGSLKLKLYYTRKTYSLSSNDSSAGTITKSGNIKYGENITCTANPNPGYDFAGWYSGNILLSRDTTCSFVVNQNVVAKFEPKAELANFTFTATNNSCVITGVKNKNISSVTIPDGVTSIGNNAFLSCTNLTSVVIGNSVTSIGDYAFYNCKSLTSITIPDSVTSIGSSAFYDCGSLTSVVIPDKVTTIGSYAFLGCKRLTSVVVGSSVKSVGSSAFEDCYRLVEVVNKSSKITVEKGSSSNGYLGWYALAIYNNNSGIKESQLEIDDGYIVYTEGSEKIVVGNVGVKTQLRLPSYITKINRYAFMSCDMLTKVVIENNVKDIGRSAFQDCSSLTSVTIGDSVTSIGDSAFNWCTSLTSVTIGDGVTSIGWNAFANCAALSNAIIGNSVTSIGAFAFEKCNSLYSIIIPKSVTSIGNYAFYNCYRLAEVVNKSPSITVKAGDFNNNGCIGNYALKVYNSKDIFVSTKLYNENGYIVYADNNEKILVGYIGKSTQLVFPSNITKITDTAFEECRDIVSISIPNSVKEIGKETFYNCIKLTTIQFKGTKEQWDNITKGKYWNYSVPAKYVSCTNGTVSF